MVTIRPEQLSVDARAEEAAKREEARKQRILEMGSRAWWKKHNEAMRKARNGEFACESYRCPGEHALAPEPCAADAHTFEGDRWRQHCSTCGWPGHVKTKGGPVVATKQGGTVLDRTTHLCILRTGGWPAPEVYVPPVPLAQRPLGVPVGWLTDDEKAAKRRARLGNSDERIDPLDLCDLEEYG